MNRFDNKPKWSHIDSGRPEPKPPADLSLEGLRAELVALGRLLDTTDDSLLSRTASRSLQRNVLDQAP